MEPYFSSDFKLGIMAGGQLGKMMCLAAANWDVQTWVMDADPTGPAGGCCRHFVKGSQADYDDVLAFGRQVDVLTFEIEHINVAALQQLESEGRVVRPSSAVLALIQDKGTQKEFYAQHGLPTSPYTLFKNVAEVREALEAGRLSLPFVQKLRRGGYDGRGVAVIETEADLAGLLDGPCVVEPRVAIQKEIAVIAARSANGQVRCFPAVEMVFKPGANLVDLLACPARLDAAVAQEAESIASRLIEQMDVCGLLAVEFFLTSSQELLINEAAPRTHNSGHHTIESVATSQFEQMVRSVLGLPLGGTALLKPAVMVNLVGEPGYEGDVVYEGLDDCLAMDGVHVHIYGKRKTRPNRKMGHVTIMGDSLDQAQERANKVKALLKVKA